MKKVLISIVVIIAVFLTFNCSDTYDIQKVYQYVTDQTIDIPDVEVKGSLAGSWTYQNPELTNDIDTLVFYGSPVITDGKVSGALHRVKNGSGFDMNFKIVNNVWYAEYCLFFVILYQETYTDFCFDETNDCLRIDNKWYYKE